jgi:hypothetical protein
MRKSFFNTSAQQYTQKPKIPHLNLKIKIHKNFQHQSHSSNFNKDKARNITKPQKFQNSLPQKNLF